VAEAQELPRPGAIFKPRRRFEKRGLLLAGEGLDGCGKTTIMKQLGQHLEANGRDAVLTNWNETVEVYNLMMHLNLSGDLSPEMRCIFGAAELAARYHYVILPALREGKIVLANKYLLSALAHSLIRGQDREFVARAYHFALKPDLTIYFDIPPEVALERKLRSGSIGFWEAGLDLALDASLEQSLQLYQSGALGEDFLKQSFLGFQTRLKGFHLEILQEEEDKVLRVDATLPPAFVFDRCADALDRLGFFARPEPRAWAELPQELP
jgi:dTMP kinase